MLVLRARSEYNLLYEKGNDLYLKILFYLFHINISSILSIKLAYIESFVPNMPVWLDLSPVYTPTPKVDLKTRPNGHAE
jgi:hypothetical protein